MSKSSEKRAAKEAAKAVRQGRLAQRNVVESRHTAAEPMSGKVRTIANIMELHLDWSERTKSCSDVYLELTALKLIPECPTTMTDSAMGAIRAFVLGDKEVFKLCYNAAKDYGGSMEDYPEKGRLRAEWIAQTIRQIY